MPITDQHKKQKGKNLLLLLVLVGLIGIVYYVTILKMSSGT